ncbi:hypothetical protein NPIL_314051 [Nephila pilipes]|uniref:Uncharacterized protein n=1 Tax=Nephila pilipes TaxID=299642 RepID=A0A8X6P954_NEPPI|nr:hypothetical protein NPIL_314051 [Nephila pilipes]
MCSQRCTKIILGVPDLSEALHCMGKSIFHHPQHSLPDLLKPAHLFTDVVNKETPYVSSSVVITRLVDVYDVSSTSPAVTVFVTAEGVLWRLLITTTHLN